MIDQTSVNLLQLVGGNLKRAARTDSGEYAGACPFCGGHDRFRVWPHSDTPHWWCRQCDQSGDAIAFVRQKHGVDFKTALAMLGLHGNTPRWQPAPLQVREPEPLAPPSDAWQEFAWEFVLWAETLLWHDTNSQALNWLRKRGFTEHSIKQFRLGFNPEDRYVKRVDWRLPDLPSDRAGGRPRTHIWLPRGIFLPWFIDGQLWKLFIRRPIPSHAWEAVWKPPRDAPESQGSAASVLRCLRGQRSFITSEKIAHQCCLSLEATEKALTELDAAKLVQRPTKHYQVPGGSNELFNATALRSGKPSILVESALDAIAIEQEAGELITPVATGTTGARDLKRMPHQVGQEMTTGHAVQRVSRDEAAPMQEEGR